MLASNLLIAASKLTVNFKWVSQNGKFDGEMTL